VLLIGTGVDGRDLRRQAADRLADQGIGVTVGRTPRWGKSRSTKALIRAATAAQASW